MKLKIFFFVVLSWIMLVSSCKPQNNEDIKKEIEDSIEISYWDGPTVIEGDHVITVDIKNQSRYCIEFPINFNLRVFTKHNGLWVEIPDTVERSGGKSGVITLYARGDFRNTTFVSSYPDLSDITLPADFYASIEGNLCDNKNLTVRKEIPFRILPNP